MQYIAVLKLDTNMGSSWSYWFAPNEPKCVNQKPFLKGKVILQK